MTSMTGSRFFAKAMQAYGTTHVFLVPTILTPALAEMEEMEIVRITAHSEKAAVYMADGYARISHRPGICMSQTIGAANMAAALRDPFLACSPVIAITGGRFSETKYRHVYQEIEDFPLFEPLSKFNVQIDLPERLPDLLRQAFRSATTGCPGPVHLEVGGNFGQAIEGEADLELFFEQQFSTFPAIRTHPEPEKLQIVAELLKTSQKPIIVAGGGVMLSGAHLEVRKLSEILSIPVATSLNAKGTLPENHPRSVGVVGSYSRTCANRLVAEADLVFFIGSRTGGQVTNNWLIPRKGRSVIQLDIEPSELGRNYPNVCSLWGDAKVSLKELIKLINTNSMQGNQVWLERVQQVVDEWHSEVRALRYSEAVPMRPERICKEIEAVLPSDSILVSDTGHAGIWSGTHIELHHPSQTYIRAAGSLGWGLPAAIGAKCAAPNRPVICFTGDGGFYYHFAELETAIRYGIHPVIIVNNNHSLNQETEIFSSAYGGKQYTGLEMWQFQDLNIAKIAESLGCLGLRVEQPEEIGPAVCQALQAEQPAVLDVVSDLEVLAPEPWA